MAYTGGWGGGQKISIRRIDRKNENYEGKICGQIGKDYIHKPTNN